MRDSRRFHRASILSLALSLAALATLGVGFPSAHADPPTKPDYSNGTVVHFGDSMVDAGLQQAFRPKFAAEKTRYLNFGKSSTYLANWAFGPDLSTLYFSHRPALFLITLGANETRAKPESRVSSVRQIVKTLKGTPCVWISIPMWKNEPTTLNEMIRRESTPCRYFDSAAVADQLPRNRDGIHPTPKGGAVWADAIWKWLGTQRDTTKGPWILKAAPAEEHGPRTSG
jgi:lysophospholipase L1-like esterase